MTAKQLMKAALDCKSVTGFHLGGIPKPMPAAFIVSMQFGTVTRILPRLKIYKPRKDQWAKPPWKRKSSPKCIPLTINEI